VFLIRACTLFQEAGTYGSELQGKGFRFTSSRSAMVYGKQFTVERSRSHIESLFDNDLVACYQTRQAAAKWAALSSC